MTRGDSTPDGLASPVACPPRGQRLAAQMTGIVAATRLTQRRDVRPKAEDAVTCETKVFGIPAKQRDCNVFSYGVTMFCHNPGEVPKSRPEAARVSKSLATQGVERAEPGRAFLSTPSTLSPLELKEADG